MYICEKLLAGTGLFWQPLIVTEILFADWLIVVY